MTQPTDPHPFHLLLIDDEADHVELVRRACAAHPRRFEVQVAGSLEQARGLLATAPALDLIILDLMLPDGHGTTLLAGEIINQTYPIVILTGQGDEAVAVEAIKKGALDYIVKSPAALNEIPRIALRAAREWAHITRRKEAEAALKRKLEFEESVSLISSKFVGIIDFNEVVRQTLGELGVWTGADRAHLVQFSRDGEKLEFTHSWDKRNGTSWLTDLHAAPTSQYPWALTKIRNGEMVHIPDIDQLPPEADSDHAGLGDLRICACLCVPLRKAAQIAGFLGVVNTEKHGTWGDEDITMVRVTADIIGHALARKGMEEAERAARRTTEALRETMAALTEALTLPQVLDEILIYLKKVIPYDSASIYLLEGDQLRVKASTGAAARAHALKQVVPAATPIFDSMLRDPKPILLENARKHPHASGWALPASIRAWIGVPLHVRGKIIGTLMIGSTKPARYVEADTRLAQTFASQAAIAIENARMFEEIQNLAITDPLTGLLNRRHFFQLAAMELIRAHRYQRPISAIMVDIDRFKRVNDLLGHAGGDQVLSEAARLLQDGIRNTDVLARYGGEEFVVLLPESNLASAEEVAERLRRHISQAVFQSESGVVKITISLGVACVDSEEMEIDDLLKRADQALFRAKRQGRDQTQVWRPTQ